MRDQSILPDPYIDEALSSWMNRVRQAVPGPEIHVLWRATQKEISESPLTTVYRGGRDIGQDDYDFRFCLPEIDAFASLYGLSMDWIKSNFAPPSKHIVPVGFRSDYCPRCMEEAVREIGSPVYLKSWRMLLKPFCEKHWSVLRSANFSKTNAICFADDIFSEDSDRPEILAREARFLELDASVQLLSLSAVQRLNDLLSSAHNAQIVEQVERFILTLMRAVLSPEQLHNYSSVLNYNARAAGSFRVYQDTLSFYNFPFTTTAITRARAFYLIGLLLGWISEKAAVAARPASDFYLATSASYIWSRIKSKWRILPILELYSTDIVGTSSLIGRHS